MIAQLLPARETRWTTVSILEAKEFIEKCVVWWRPNSEFISENPDMDEAWIRED